VVANRTDLLNETFTRQTKIEDKEDVAVASPEPPCILDNLCNGHGGIISEVKSIREHWWKPHIKKFFETKVNPTLFSNDL